MASEVAEVPIVRKASYVKPLEKSKSFGIRSNNPNLRVVEENKALYRTISSPVSRNLRKSSAPPSLLVDVVETKDSYMIYADLPGMKKSEINLTVKDRTMALTAKRTCIVSEGHVYHRQERHNGTVSR